MESNHIDSKGSDSFVIPSEVRELAECVPLWRNTRNVRIEPLTGTISLNNSLYRVVADDSAYILRYAADAGRYLGIRRQDELAIAQAAAEAQLALPILFSDPAGHMVLPFIDGRHWKPEEFQEPHNIARLGEAIRRLHAIPNISGVCNVFQRIEFLLTSARELGIKTPPEIERYREKLTGWEAERASDPRFTSGINHNDLWGNNFLDDGDNLYLLDWEFAGNGDGIYDLTTIILQGGYSDDRQSTFLKACGIEENIDDVIEKARFVVYFFEGAWALVLQGLRPEAEFDYANHAQEMFEQLGRW